MLGSTTVHEGWKDNDFKKEDKHKKFGPEHLKGSDRSIRGWFEHDLTLKYRESLNKFLSRGIPAPFCLVPKEVNAP